MSKDIFNGSTGNRATFLLLDADGLAKTGVAWNAAGLVLSYKVDVGAAAPITLSSLNWHEIGGGKYYADIIDDVYLPANLGKLIQFYGTLANSSVYGEQHRVVGYNPSVNPATTLSGGLTSYGVSTSDEVAAVSDSVWSKAFAGFTTAGTFGYLMAALASMIESVGSAWRFKATAVSEVAIPAQTGDWAITRTFQVAGGDKVSGVRMSLVGVAGKADTTGTDGIATIQADDGTFTLRVVVPAGYELVADTSVEIDGADDTATVTLVATTIPDPPAANACTLSIYVRNQAKAAFPGVTVSGRFPRGWAVTDGTMNLNEVVTDVTDANGLAQLVLFRDQEYDLSFSRANGTIAKIRITTPDAATATLSQSYQG